jgi:hypothetical protein
VRICLATPATREELTSGLQRLAALLASRPSPTAAVVWRGAQRVKRRPCADRSCASAGRHAAKRAQPAGDDARAALDRQRGKLHGAFGLVEHALRVNALNSGESVTLLDPGNSRSAPSFHP